MSEEKQEKPMKKLYDYTVLKWDFPENSWIDPYFKYGGNTVLKENLGIESLEEKAGDYIVHASASKHLIGVHRCDREYMGCRRDEIPLEEELFFKGAIAIYKKDDLVINDSIWYALEESNDFKLKELIFENAEKEKEKEKLVEKIINAYEYKDEKKREADLEKSIQDRKDGERSGRWKMRHGYYF